ncbi:hypothetical protein J4E93_008041 [Alternaria ventricosa]|uniref:uncharacterized protein n=1 Tax=Alternaria ventricosa TaxID=1187951 RepID=UPI0020C26773|nr:uncharacterized protein J4E93_008041 [Alternaria ventricosa]KAI4641163.1 hypothetical protein J4E93_008041 [Alternaria ventricosa]
MGEKPKLVTIDPNGDMLIKLKYRSTLQSKWKNESESLGDWIAQAEAAKASIENETAQSKQIPTQPTKVHYLVSSRQLRIVSPYFEKMFKRNYDETVPNTEDGLYHVRAQQWNPHALAIMLNIAHLQFVALPKKISVRLFVALFLVADYYQMEDALRLFTKEWQDQLQEQLMPTVYCEELMLWMFLGVKLKEWEVFESMASMAMREACCPIQFLDLPFPRGEKGVGQLDSMRCAAIQELLAGTHKLNQDLYEGNVGCGYGCSATMLGFLQKSLWDHKLLSRIEKHDQHPFEELSFEVLYQKLSGINHFTYSQSHGTMMRAGCCEIHNHLLAICEKAEAHLELDLGRFQPEHGGRLDG